MAAFKEPQKFNVVPGNAADVTAIQDAASVLNPSMTDLFPAIYQLALAAGGKAPERTTFNQFLKLYGEALYFLQRGGVWSYDATADYPAGAVVGYSGSLYLALKDNGPGTDAGAVQPDADGEVWQRLETAADLAKVLLGYLPVATAEADYLKKTDAEADYLKKTDASDIYQTKEDLSSQIITSVRGNWYAAYPDGAEAHNAMWGGRDITAAFNNGTVSEHIADGTFKDIFPGDYITKQVTISGTAYTVNWVVADCDYWINKGDQNNGIETHHVVIVPQAPIFNARMNPTNTTEGGYAGSEMYRNIIPACATGIVNAFGSDHILTFRDAITNSVDTSHVSSGMPQFTGTPGWWGAWVSAQCNLMSEKMVYGAPIFSAGATDSTMATRQMSAFRLSERLINYNRAWWWLRDVVSSALFAGVGTDGTASTYYASIVVGVRPFALLV